MTAAFWKWTSISAFGWSLRWFWRYETSYPLGICGSRATGGWYVDCGRLSFDLLRGKAR